MGETRTNVAQLLREPIGSKRNYQFQSAVEIGRGEEVFFEAQADFLRTEKGILVHARVEAVIPEICSRCLASFSYPLQVELWEEFYPTVEVNLGYRLPPPEDPSAFTIDGNHILDIQEAVRQYLVLALPLKPLCRAQCAGLCPHCGQNLNQGPCQCPPSPPDPRWAGLSKLVAAGGGLNQKAAAQAKNL